MRYELYSSKTRSQRKRGNNDELAEASVEPVRNIKDVLMSTFDEPKLAEYKSQID